MKWWYTLFLLIIIKLSLVAQTPNHIYLGGFVSPSLDQYSFYYFNDIKTFDPNSSIGLRMGYERRIFRNVAMYAELGLDAGFNIFIDISNGVRNESSFRFSRRSFGVGGTYYINTGISFLESIGLGVGAQYVSMGPLRVVENNSLIHEGRYNAILMPIGRVAITFKIFDKLSIQPQARLRFGSIEQQSNPAAQTYNFNTINLTNIELGMLAGFTF